VKWVSITKTLAEGIKSWESSSRQS